MIFQLLLTAALAFSTVTDGATDQPQQTDGQTQEVTTARWNKVSSFIQNGFVIASPDRDYSLKIGLRTHFRLTMEAPDNTGHQLNTTFTIPAAKLTLSGNLFGNVLYYAVEGDFGGGNPSLQDCFVSFAFIPNKLHLQIGQWKAPLFRQAINSSGRLELPETTFFHRRFGAFNDLGIALHNNYTKSPTFEWVVAFLNGSNMNNLDHIHPRLSFRGGYNSPGMINYAESDFTGGPMRFSIAGNLLLDFDTDNHTESRIVSSIDFMLKFYHFAISGALFLSSKQEHRPDSAFKDQIYGESAAYGQISYLFIRQLAPIYRFAIISANKDLPACLENSLGLTWYIVGHNLKWQIMGGVRTNAWTLEDNPVAPDPRKNTYDWRFISQLVFQI